MYVANVNGAPTKPSNVASVPFNSFLNTFKLSPVKFTLFSGSNGVTAFTPAMSRIGLKIIGPVPLTMSNGMFIPANGVKISENTITPSGLNASYGCKEISTHKSTVSERSRNVVCFLHKSWYTFMYRPACRIIQIGGRSHRSPLIVRTMSGSLSPPPEEDALITLVLVLVDVVPFRLADKEVVEPHRGAHTNAFCVIIIIITRTLGKCYSLSLSLSQNDTVYYVRPLALLFGGRIRATRVCHALALF
mmetsp:Transcript_1534/g.5587  ORF Transcript_1534/g.5587 Transcript_1534/m.5587 type:complete len:247 (-) Transcript_1534:40-780(-)